MFDLDIAIFNFIYYHCLKLGSVFFMGAFEGAMIYATSIIFVIGKVLESKK